MSSVLFEPYQRKLALESLYRKKASVEAKISEQKKLQESYNELKIIEDYCISVYTQILDEYRRLQKISKMINKESISYKQKRVDFIEAELTSLLSSIFPDRGFQASLDINSDKLNPSLKVLLKPKNKKIRNPGVTEGGCFGDLVSISIPVSVLLVNNSRVFFLDEALSNASASSKADFQRTLERYIELGMQVIMICQTNELYLDLPRTELVLDFDPITEVTSLAEIRNHEWRKEDEVQYEDDEESRTGG